MGWVILLLVVLAGLAWIRFSPNDPARWHQPIGNAEDVTGAGWAARVMPTSQGMLSALNQALLAERRTELIAGSVADGRLTYITRSKWMGYPDFTTIEEVDGQIKLYARLRFGRSDFGVNAQRLERVIARAKARG